MKKGRLIFTLLTSVLALAACNTTPSGSNGDTPTPDTSTSTPPSQPDTPSTGEVELEAATISIWTTYNDSYQTIINNAIEEFTALHPNIKIENTKQQGSYDDLRDMVVNGFAVDNYPDIVAAYPDSVADFINNFKALDVTPYMEDEQIGWTEEDYNDIPETYIAMGQQYAMPGTYSLPASKSTEAMYYNQKILGIDLSGIDATINGGEPLTHEYINNLTWEELFEHLIPALDTYDNSLPADKKLIDRTTYTDWAWVGYDSDDNFFITLAEQYGYGYTGLDQVTGKGKVLFNNPEMKGLMKKFTGYHKQHYFTTKGIITENCNFRSTADAMLFAIGSTGGVKYQFSASNPQNVGVAHIPYAEGGKRSIISQGPDLAFLDHGSEARARATWAFYKFFTSTKYNTAWALQTGYSPIRYSVLESEDYAEYSNVEDKEERTLDRLLALNAQYAVNVGNRLFTSVVFKGSSEARSQVGTIFSACAASTNLDADIDRIFKTAEDNTLLKM